MLTCKVYNAKVARESIQATLFFRKKNATFTMPSIEYDNALIKEVIAKMICVHEYSFRMVEHQWFNIFMKCLNPNCQPMGRKAIRAECMRVYKKQKELLKVDLKGVDFISLTTDLWTSNQTISYMCVVAHYIDKDWKMQTRVLSFMELDPPHSGHVIADAIYECVTEWKIEKKIISITLDNASNNDGVVKGLKAKFVVRRGTDFEAKYFHVRCCAHIINLVVQDGTTIMAPLVENLREMVKYFKKSPARLHKFVETCKSLGVKVGKHLHLDCTTRWNSTYKMLDTSNYREALSSYAATNANYQWEPEKEEWRGMKMRMRMLRTSSCPSMWMWGIPTIDIHHVGVALAILEMKINVILACGLWSSM